MLNSNDYRSAISLCERIFQLSFKKEKVSLSELESDGKGFGAAASLRRITARLDGDGIIDLSGNEIVVRNRMVLAEILLKAGRSPDTLSQFLGWREFEQFCRGALEANGFVVRSNIRFKDHRKRFEIDLVAAKSPYLLFIDCKHWRPGSSSSYKRAALRQRLRMEAALSTESSLGISQVIGLSRFKRLSLIVSLADVPVREFEGSPIVPIFRFNHFLLGLDQFWDKMRAESIGAAGLENRIDL